MIKAVLFDFGGVLTEGGKLGSIRGMFAQAYGVQPEHVRLDDSVQSAFRGTITDEAFAAAINRLNPQYKPAPITIFTEDAEFFNRCTAVYELAERLRTQGIQTALFSNVFAASAEVLQRDGFYDGFAPLFLSCTYHLLKPEKAFYDLIIRELRLEPTEILFIDDKDDFLAPAREVGMHTALAVSPQQIVDDVTALIRTQNGMDL